MKLQNRSHTKPKGIFGLQARMTISYLIVAFLYVLLLESLGITAFFLIVTHLPGASAERGRFPTFPNILLGMFFTALFWLVVVTPAGAVFGALFTRGLVRRIHRLVQATTSFAEGDYSQRVPVAKRDEVGLLEARFNQMAQQLVESMRKEQELIEYNARAEERARIEQEMQTARLIQLSLLPKELPSFVGWQLATHYQPAKEVGGDLYDFLLFADGRLGLVIGDAADKGVPAAMMMAATRSMLRAAALTLDSPGEVLARVNNLLFADTPERMFVTCFYAILEPESGKMRYANAGHDLPYQQNRDGIIELLATGMPLGLMPNMQYEEREVQIGCGDSILFYSDGLVEAHNTAREMFGFPRLKTLLAAAPTRPALIDHLLADLKEFTGADWDQEDDVTLVALIRQNELP
ncbi:MAG TPA: SpoIIE family protein phosphatase [Ktedonobacteraceae bacterium]